MNIRKFFSQVLGVVESAPQPIVVNKRIPAVLLDLYALNSLLKESILKTDVRILEANEFYKVDRYTVFAEESQNVVFWGYVDGNDDSECFQIGNENPVVAIPEERNLKDTVLALAVVNSLSSGLFPYYEYLDLEKEYLEHIEARFPRVTEVSKLPVIIKGGVVCTLQLTDALFVSAASRNEKELEEFIRSVKESK